MFENAKEEFIIGRSKPEYRPVWLRIFVSAPLNGRCFRRLRKLQARYRRRRRRIQILGVRDGLDEGSSLGSKPDDNSEKSDEDIYTKQSRVTHEAEKSSKAGKSSI